VTGPIDPDGDSIGACLALAKGVAKVSPTTKVEVAGVIGFRYEWLPGADAMVPDSSVAGSYDLVVVLDGDRRRLVSQVDAAFKSAPSTAILDHHGSTTPEGYTLAYLDPRAASTCEMVDGVLQDWEVPLDKDIAALLYTGLIFDTGGFRHSNTNAATHAFAARLISTGIDHATISARILVERRMPGLRLLGRVVESARFLAGGRVALGDVSLALARELGADIADLEGIVDALLYTQGVEMAVLAVERGPMGDRPTVTKLSFRSRTDLDVAALAKSLASDGGGHPRASGVALGEPLPDVLAWLPGVLERAVAPRAAR
jgi:bifunctional oligoribonuclease and PAP phosphatase NrnA